LSIRPVFAASVNIAVMDPETFEAVDRFIGETVARDDEALVAAVAAAAAAGLPEIQVSPPQGKLLHLLARSIGAKRILEFGTLGGYSTIWLARALPEDGKLLSLEAKDSYAEVARASIERAGLGRLVEVRAGPALETLVALEDEGVEPFDLVFIDADKVNTPNYIAWSLDHVRPGALIVADNVVRGGTLADANSDDVSTEAQRRLHDLLAAEPRVEATTIQTVGSKGHDGFTLALVDG
jgi:predicted O-methyltransferase YrrM